MCWSPHLVKEYQRSIFNCPLLVFAILYTWHHVLPRCRPLLAMENWRHACVYLTTSSQGFNLTNIYLPKKPECSTIEESRNIILSSRLTSSQGWHPEWSTPPTMRLFFCHRKDPTGGGRLAFLPTAPSPQPRMKTTQHAGYLMPPPTQSALITLQRLSTVTFYVAKRTSRVLQLESSTDRQW